MKQYLDLVKNILDNGDIKDAARENMPRTKELFGITLTFDLKQGFPLLTTKKMYVRGVIEELLWFLRGSTDVSELIKKNTNIWNEDGYKYYKKRCIEQNKLYLTYEEWTNLKGYQSNDYTLGKIYGYHWRKWGEGYINKNTNKEVITDQILNLVNSILKTPNSRYQIVSAWNPTVITEGEAALPSCHTFFQTSIREKKYIDLFMYQRSVDVPCGLPFNIASYTTLIHILSILTGYEVGKFIWVGGSTHIYENQVEGCLMQLNRRPKHLPTLTINTNDINDYIVEGKKNGYTSELLDKIFNKLSFVDFNISGYEPYPTIKFPLSTGLKLDNYELVW